MKRLAGFGKEPGCGESTDPVPAQGSGSVGGSRDAGHRSLAEGYEPPQLRVIGSVRDLTTGSSSSGKKDANSQYYW